MLIEHRNNIILSIYFARRYICPETIDVLNEVHAYIIRNEYWTKYFNLALSIDNARFWLKYYLIEDLSIYEMDRSLEEYFKSLNDISIINL